MTAMTGLGWVSAGCHGAVRRGLEGAHDDLRALYRTLREERVLPNSMPNFARSDGDSRRLCLATGLALHDAELLPGGEEARETGILIAGPDGSQAANLAYFRDYVAGGRVLGRGNLFIYTLPTSPGAEAAIGYGLGGPLLYVGRTEDDGLPALEDARALVRSGHARAMVFCFAPAPGELACAVFGSRPDRRGGLETSQPGWPTCVRRLMAAAKGNP